MTNPLSVDCDPFRGSMVTSSELKNNNSSIGNPINTVQPSISPIDVLNKRKNYLEMTPIVIGDRVRVGAQQLLGNVAFVGPTHFCVEEMAVHSTYSQSPSPQSSHSVTSFDSRRFSKRQPTPPVRAGSARYVRNSVNSPVYGALSPATNSSSSCGTMRRTQSARFKTERPQWLPPGSHDKKSNGLTHDANKPIARFERSKTLPRTFDMNSNRHSSVSPTARYPNRLSQSCVFADPHPYSPLGAAPNVSKSLSVIDRRGTVRKERLTHSESYHALDRPVRRKADTKTSTWPRTALSVPHDVIATQERYRNLLDSFSAMSVHNGFPSPDRPLSTSSVFGKNMRSTALQLDSVILCAQDRLMQLQHHLLQVYRERTKVASELAEQQRLYQRLRDFYTAYRSGQLRLENGPIHGPKKQKDVEKLRTLLQREFNRTKQMWLELKELHSELDNQCPLPLPMDASHMLARDLNTSSPQRPSSVVSHPLDPVAETEEVVQRRNTTEYPSFRLKRVSVQDFAVEKLKAVEMQGEQYAKTIDTISDQKELIQQKLNEVRQRQEMLNGSVDQELILRAVHDLQKIRITDTQKLTHRTALELSVVQADISHLSSQPVGKARRLLDKHRISSRKVVTLQDRIQSAEKENSDLRYELDSLKNQIEVDDRKVFSVFRTSLRMQQLRQFEYQARTLLVEQHELAHKKLKEVHNAVDEMNLMSNLWANERQLRAQSNENLRTQLARISVSTDTNQLSSSMEISSMKSIKGVAKNQPPSLKPITYELFGTMCKEIRRLQSRSANLVDALQCMSSMNLDAASLDSIRTLVFRTPNPKSYANISPYFHRSPTTSLNPPIPAGMEPSLGQVERFNSMQSSAPNANNLQLQNGSIPSDIHPNGDTKVIQQEIKAPTHHFPFPVVIDRRHTRAPPQPFGTHLRRRRPMSMHIRRTYEPVVEIALVETEEEYSLQSP